MILLSETWGLSFMPKRVKPAKPTPVKRRTRKTKKSTNRYFLYLKNIGLYYTTKRAIIFAFVLIFLIGVGTGWGSATILHAPSKETQPVKKDGYWFVLYRKSNLEQLFYGTPGNYKESSLVKTFMVKTGVPGQRPTPLPQLLGKEYWMVTRKYETSENPETGRYFIELDVPNSFEYPYGPLGYEECNGQCDWVLPGPFGLHGVNGDVSRLTDFGSSGCIRHQDSDIAYLYSLLDPSEGIRYYIQDI